MLNSFPSSLKEGAYNEPGMMFLGFTVQGLGFRGDAVEGVRFRNLGFGFKMQGSSFGPVGTCIWVLLKAVSPILFFWYKSR